MPTSVPPPLRPGHTHPRSRNPPDQEPQVKRLGNFPLSRGSSPLNYESYVFGSSLRSSRGSQLAHGGYLRGLHSHAFACLQRAGPFSPETPRSLKIPVEKFASSWLGRARLPFSFSAQFLRGFVVSANLSNTFGSFCNGKWKSPQICAILRETSTTTAQKTSKSLLAKFPRSWTE